MRVDITTAERDHLVRLLERNLADQRVEVRRTSTPAYHDQLLKEEHALRGLLEKLKTLRESA